MRIVLDAMGGDWAPEATVEGAVLAARAYEITVVLVGQEEVVRQELARHDTSGLNLPIVPASQVVEMTDKPADIVRGKPDSSMHVGMELVSQGQAEALVTMGNTGGALAVALLKLGRIRLNAHQRIYRPALGTTVPTVKGSCFFLDIGANTDWKPVYLQQFAVMGSIYAESVLGVPSPRVGLVSVGEEEGKGSIEVREAFELIKATPGLNFIGNVEGRDITAGLADVAVTDGFTGNVMIKLAEGVASMIMQTLRQEITSRPLAQVGALLAKPAFQAAGRRLDYQEVGGAILLGLNHICVIGHGRSTATAVRSGIRAARDAASADVASKIRQGLAERTAMLDSAPED
jgi:glycerol-3-phosphate acyltransferase PlsX